MSHEGMREQHAGRAPWELVKELVQNAGDEAPEATVCRIETESASHKPSGNRDCKPEADHRRPAAPAELGVERGA